MQCASCGMGNDGSGRFCVRCGHQLGAAPYPGAGTYPQAGQYPGSGGYGGPSPIREGGVPVPYGVRRGSPFLAGFLSFMLPGLGQLYNGDWKKGLLMLALILCIGPLVFLLFEPIVWFAVMIWAVIDAAQVAGGSGRRWN